MARDSDDGNGPKGAGGAREIILERRKFFIASALAGLAWSSCKRSEPQPCLSEPMVCLSPMPVDEPDAGSIDAGTDDGANEPADAGAPVNSAGTDAGSATASGSAQPDAGTPKPPEPPKPVPPRPPPRPCLKMVMPTDPNKTK